MRILVLVLLLLLGGLQYRLWVGEGSLAEVTALRREIQAQKAEIEKLQSRNRRLQAEVEDLRQGLDALEERARSELGMIKEGELFLQLIEPDPPVAGAAAAGGQTGQGSQGSRGGQSGQGVQGGKWQGSSAATPAAGAASTGPSVAVNPNAKEAPKAPAGKAEAKGHD